MKVGLKTKKDATSFAVKNDILFINLWLTHARWSQGQKGKTVPKKYQCRHINGSSHFYNMADYGITVHRRYQEETVERCMLQKESKVQAFRA